MKRFLYIKFLLGYAFVAFVGFLCIATFGANLLYKQIQQHNIKKMYQTTNTICENYQSMYNSGQINIDSMQPQLSTASIATNTTVWILDVEGTLLYNSDTNGIAVGSQTPFDSLDSINHYMVGDFYGLLPDNTTSVFVPLLSSDFGKNGYIIIHLFNATLLHDTNTALNIAYITYVFIVLLSGILLFIFHYNVYIPIKKITKAANEYSSGNLTYKMNLKSYDEIGYLSSILEYMATRLNGIKEDQHKFIANVSHDFRSPLTSIKGYIEAMLDHTIPPEFSEKYLNIVLEETNRLNKLTQSLLTLNSMDKQGTYLDCTCFDVHHIIKQVLATFEGRCMEKEITFDLTYSSREQYVYGDMGKIQQVLYNLIDNAIKFSNPNSTIHIRTYVLKEKVFISIKDNGIGIPKSSIHKIWDRFYKTDTSRGKDKMGTGLGLSITKEIIQAHGENIDVISTEGVGTEFIFSLPVGKR